MVFSAALVRERRTMEDPCAPGFFSFEASTPTIAFLAALLVARAKGTEFLVAVVALALQVVMRPGGREFLKDVLAFPLLAVMLVSGGRDFRDDVVALALLVVMSVAPDM